MTTEQLKERIQKTEIKIQKIEKRIAKWQKAQDSWELDRAIQDLHDTQLTLDNYKRQLSEEEARNEILNHLPAVLQEFKEHLIFIWDNYDFNKQKEIKEEYKKYETTPHTYSESKIFWRDMHNKYGHGWYDFMHKKSDEIIKSNIKDANALILNLLARTQDITGKITNCQYLTLDSDNQGYSIINGIVIGEKGKARVESIGAGGYNIQRYHIRVLVKEVK